MGISLLIHCGRVSQTYPELADTVKLANQLAPRILSLSMETRIGEGELAYPPHVYMSYRAPNSGFQACLANILTTGLSPQPLHFCMLRCCV